MASFTNYATLTYVGGATDSNTVTGELLETLEMTKTAVVDSYNPGSGVTYVISLINSSTAGLTGLLLTDDLGGYLQNSETRYPLSYTDGSIRYYVNGLLQTAPSVTAGPPLTVSSLSIPAGGNAIIVYEATTTDYAPLGLEATITNTATVSGDSVSIDAQETIAMKPEAVLSISKALCPATVAESGQLTYTFVIENRGSVPASADDQLILSDTFNPQLNNMAVSFNGTVLAAGTDYTYDSLTGVFATTAGKITVPAATYTQSTDGTWVTTPGTATVVITGTV